MQTCEDMMANQEDIKSEQLLSKGVIHLCERIGVCHSNLYKH